MSESTGVAGNWREVLELLELLELQSSAVEE